MTLKLWALIILLLSCDLAPLIYANKPDLSKSSKEPTITPPTKQAQNKHAGSRKPILAKSRMPISVEGAEISTDSVQRINELKQETASYLPWNFYANAAQSPIHFPFSIPTMFDTNPYSPFAKLMSFFGYSQPVFLPFPIMMSPDMFYHSFTDSQPLAEDTMSRTAGNGRRPIHAGPNSDFLRNSPTYHVRLPPTPYMFLPSFNYAPTPSFQPLLPYSQLSALHALPMSSMFSLPLNFMANGKPSGIYRIDSAPNVISNNNLPFSGARPNQFNYSYRPVPSNLTPPPPSSQTSSSTFSTHQSNPQFSFPSAPPSITADPHDSKLNSFKRPFIFNGRPEDIYILPNDFNPSGYSENSFF